MLDKKINDLNEYITDLHKENEALRKKYVDAVEEIKSLQEESKTIPIRRATYEELTEVITDLHTQNYLKEMEIIRLHSIIKEVRKYIEQYGNLYCLKHTQFKNYHQYKAILEILDKVGSDKE